MILRANAFLLCLTIAIADQAQGRVLRRVRGLGSPRSLEQDGDTAKRGREARKKKPKKTAVSSSEERARYYDSDDSDDGLKGKEEPGSEVGKKDPKKGGPKGSDTTARTGGSEPPKLKPEKGKSDAKVAIKSSEEDKAVQNDEFVNSWPTAGPTTSVVVSAEEIVTADSEGSQFIATQIIQGTSFVEIQSDSVPGVPVTDNRASLPNNATTLGESNTTNSSGDVEVPTNSTSGSGETNSTATTTAAPSNTLKCPINGWPSFKMNNFTNDFIRYPFRKGQESTDDQTGEVTFSVSETCTYKIQEVGSDRILTFQDPLEWLDMGVLYFSGIPSTRLNVSLSGDASPSMADVLVLDRGSFSQVQIVPTSDAVSGALPVAWLFPARAEAKEFEYFLNSLHRYAPQVFMTNNMMVCGSGPACKIMGSGVCFYDPNRGLLGAGNMTTGSFVEDSMAWFELCAGMIGCSRTGSDGQFLYFAVPEYKAEDAMFSFVGDSVLDGPIEFQCPSAVEAAALSDFATDLVHDPFHSFGIGGPSEPGFDHHRQAL